MASSCDRNKIETSTHDFETFAKPSTKERSYAVGIICASLASASPLHEDAAASAALALFAMIVGTCWKFSSATLCSKATIIGATLDKTLLAILCTALLTLFSSATFWFCNLRIAFSASFLFFFFLRFLLLFFL